MYSLAHFVVAIYCLIEDELYPRFCQQQGRPRRAGFPPALSDSECLTIEMVGHYLGYSTQRQLFKQMRALFGAWLPGLRDRGAFARQSDYQHRVVLLLSSQSISTIPAAASHPCTTHSWTLLPLDRSP